MGRRSCFAVARGDGLRERRLHHVVRPLERGRPGQERLAARAVCRFCVGGVAGALRLAGGGRRLERYGGAGEVLSQPVGNQRAAAARQAPAALDKTVEVVALQPDAISEHGKAGEEVGKAGERHDALAADEIEHGGGELVDPVADDAAEAMTERPAGRQRQGGETASQQQHGEREETGLFAVAADALGEHQLEPPEHGSEQQEDAGETERIEQHVGENGARRSKRVGGDAVGGMRKAGVGLRPGQEAGPRGSDAHQEREPSGADRPSNQPLFHRGRKEASRVMRPERHLERTLLRKYYY